MNSFLIVFAALFGALAAIFALLFAATFTHADRRKHQFLRRLDGKKMPLLVLTLLCVLLSGIFTASKDIALQPQSDAVSENKNTTIRNDDPTPTPSSTIFLADSSNTDTSAAKNTSGNLEEKSKKQSPSPKPSPTKTASSKVQSVTKLKSLITQGNYDAANRECSRILRIEPKNKNAQELCSYLRKRVEVLDQNE